MKLVRKRRVLEREQKRFRKQRNFAQWMTKIEDRIISMINYKYAGKRQSEVDDRKDKYNRRELKLDKGSRKEKIE